MDLKHCPFCGKPAQCETEEDYRGSFCSIFYSLGCSNTDCIAHEIYYTMTEDDLPMEQAVFNWNRRFV